MSDNQEYNYDHDYLIEEDQYNNYKSENIFTGEKITTYTYTSKVEKLDTIKNKAFEITENINQLKEMILPYSMISLAKKDLGNVTKLHNIELDLKSLVSQVDKIGSLLSLDITDIINKNQGLFNEKN